MAWKGLPAPIWGSDPLKQAADQDTADSLPSQKRGNGLINSNRSTYFSQIPASLWS